MSEPPEDRSAAIAEVGSPYRGALAEREPVAIARERSFEARDALLVGLVLTVIGLIPFGQFAYAIVLGVGTAMFAALRLAGRAGLKGVHRVDVNERGVRLRSTEAAMAQALAVGGRKPVDLFIPWRECLVIEARPHRFGDDVEHALLICTPERLIAVRQSAFQVSCEEIATKLIAARDRAETPG